VQDDLQIPSTVRVKLTTLETPVKAAMLRSSHVLGVVPAAPATPPSLRRTRSNESVASPKPLFALNATANASNEEFIAPRPAFLMDEPSSRSSKDAYDPTASPSRHARGSSLDLPRSTSFTDLANSKGKKDKTKDVKEMDKQKSKDKNVKPREKEREVISPSKFCQILANNKTVELEVDTIKKLRIMLRNEAARYMICYMHALYILLTIISRSWSEDFLKLGGYSALMSRLHELLEMEWR
jgi:predicted secreted protein